METCALEVNSSPEVPVRLVFLGNVDSGKSTLIGVLAKNELDNGRGSVRKHIFNHPHECATGRTSSISTEYCQIGGKDVLLTDLCGHEKYLKTTLFGLNLVKPDWCVLVIGGNMGVSRMTREHLGTALSLGYRVMVCVTKTDICPKHILQQTLQDIKTTCQKLRRKMVEIETPPEQDSPILNSNGLVTPLIRISSVSGENLDTLRKTITRLTTHTVYHTEKPAEFVIDQGYNVKGVGLVVAGTVNSGKVEVGQSLYLNLPDGFTEVNIRSIYNERDQPVKQLSAGHHCTLNIRGKRRQIKRPELHAGMVMVHTDQTTLCREFKAVVYIFHHQTTILPRNQNRRGYQPIIHCNGIRQSAELLNILDNKTVLRGNQKSIVHFRFRYRPEYLVVGSRFIFREGMTRGVGKVIQNLR